MAEFEPREVLDSLEVVLSQKDVSVSSSLTNLVEGFRALFQGDIAGLIAGIFGALPAIVVFLVVYFMIRFVLATTLMKNSEHQIYARGMAWGIGLGAIFQTAIFQFIWNFMSGSFIILIAFILVIFVFITFISRSNANRLAAKADERNTAAAAFDAKGNRIKSKHEYKNDYKNFRNEHPSNWSKFKKGTGQVSGALGRHVIGPAGNWLFGVKKDDDKFDADEAKKTNIDHVLEQAETRENSDEQQAEQIANTIEGLIKQIHEVDMQLVTLRDRQPQDPQKQALLQRSKQLKERLLQLQEQQKRFVEDEKKVVDVEEANEKVEERIVKDEEKVVKDELKQVKKLAHSKDPAAKALAKKEKEELRALLKDVNMEEAVLKQMEHADEHEKVLLNRINHYMEQLSNLISHEAFMNYNDPKQTEELLHLSEEIRKEQQKLKVDFSLKFRDHSRFPDIQKQIAALHAQIRSQNHG